MKSSLRLLAAAAAFLPLCAVSHAAGASDFPATPAPLSTQSLPAAPLMMQESDAALAVTVSRFDQLPLGESCVIRGTVSSIRNPDAGSNQPYTIYLQEGDSVARLVMWPMDLAAVPQVDDIKPGATIQAAGTVNDFKGTRQLKLEDATRVFVTAPAPAVAATASTAFSTPANTDATPINQISFSHIGRQMKIQGTVKSVKESTQSRIPTVVEVGDASGTITLVYWQEVSSALKAEQAPKQGDTLTAFGTVNEYRGKLQLKITNSAALAKAE